MDFKEMLSKRLKELKLRLNTLISELDNTEYDPEKLEKDFIELGKEFNDLEEKIEKESGIKSDDLEL